MLKPANEILRRLPGVDALLGSEAGAALVAEFGHSLVVEALRTTLDDWRAQLRAGAAVDVEAGPGSSDAAILADAGRWLRALMAPRLRPVFNLTGTVLHTNLGRAPLPAEALSAIAECAAGACNLEFDLADGLRGDRDALVEDWICRLTGAEAATVVNNNAAAVLLVLNTLGRGREVAVSRGELIEIGGSFRIPDVMARAGARLREVGTTNRTHPSDFAEAAGPDLGLMMKVHTSNYVVEGFTREVNGHELARIAREAGVPSVEDLGSGTLIDLTRYGLPREQTVSDTLAAGVDLVTFSGDKLLGGPQCGIVAGRGDLVALVKRNPMKRALRVDKLILAALEAVLRLYADPDALTARLPALRLLTRPQAGIRAQAERLVEPLAAAVGAAAAVDIVEVRSQIGSGALPVDLLPSAALRLTPPGGGRAVERLAGAFRRLPIPIIGRIERGALLFDLRCLDDEAAFVTVLDRLEASGH